MDRLKALATIGRTIDLLIGLLIELLIELTAKGLTVDC